MSLLGSFRESCNVAVVGASGGIGGALVALLADDPRVATVHAFSRSGEEFCASKVKSGSLDLANEESITHAAASATRDDPLDLVIVSSGLLWRGQDRQPEKTMRDLSRAGLEELFAVNAIGPALVAKHFLPKLRRGSKTVFAALSARVGSISDNRLGGWYSYRVSKAALNMALKTLSNEWRHSHPRGCVAALHPGTNDTALSKPFQGNVAAENLFRPEYTASMFGKLLSRLGPSDSGHFWAWDGAEIPW